MLFAWLTRNLMSPQEMTGSTRRQKRKHSRPLIEVLEDRLVPTATGFRPIDEVGNNVANPNWGAAPADQPGGQPIQLVRVSPAAYADGTSAPSLPDNPSARLVSNILNNQADPNNPSQDITTVDQNSLSDFGYAWGQFIDHDMDLTPDGAESFPIQVPPGDPIGGAGPLPFSRSKFDPSTGATDPRQQINVITSYLDLSNVYGSSAFIADALRTHSGGLLKTSPGNMLPFDSLDYLTQDQIDALNMANDSGLVSQSQLFAAGDRRANENMELTALQTLFVRNHNHIATELATLDPTRFGFASWTDENLYQEARKLNIAEEQLITYNAYLPDLLGPTALTKYVGYNPNVDASIATEFSTVAFRFGHSMLSGNIERHGNDGQDIADQNPNGSAVSLAQDFFDPSIMTPDANGVFGAFDQTSGHTTSDIGAFLKGDADGDAQATDLLAIDEVRNLLFGNGQFGGQDLMARDVQRARDDGIGTYNQVRVAYGLAPVTDFSQITKNVAVQNELRQAYGTVDNIDPFEGGLAEDHVKGSDMGQLFTTILADQFQRLRDGDRFFVGNESFTLAELAVLHQGNTLAKVIEANTDVTNLQRDVFVFKASISGTVFLDLNGNGQRDRFDIGVPGIVVQLLDGDGNVVATTRTRLGGRYVFTQLSGPGANPDGGSGLSATGDYSVRLVLPAFLKQTTQDPGTIQITRGDTNVTGVDFGVNLSKPLAQAGLSDLSSGIVWFLEHNGSGR
jgi:hypothetical protein